MLYYKFRIGLSDYLLFENYKRSKKMLMNMNNIDRFSLVASSVIRCCQLKFFASEKYCVHILQQNQRYENHLPCRGKSELN